MTGTGSGTGRALLGHWLGIAAAAPKTSRENLNPTIICYILRQQRILLLMASPLAITMPNQYPTSPRPVPDPVPVQFPTIIIDGFCDAYFKKEESAIPFFF